MQSKKLLLVQLGRIGDLILMTPMFKVLKEANPTNELHLLAGRNNYLLAIDHPLVDRVHIYNKRLIHTIRLIQKLRKEKFDYWIDVKDHHSTESDFLARISNAKIKIGFNRNGKATFDHSVLSDGKQVNSHAVERNLAALNFLNLNLDQASQKPILYVNDDSETKLNNFLLLHDIREYYCINISATSRYRYWQAEKWINFVNYLENRQIKCIIISSPSDSSLAEKIISAARNAFHFLTDTIVDVFSIVKHSKMTITLDTSVIHIAAAYDVPVLGLYGNHQINYTKYSPLSTNRRMIMAPRDEAPIGEISLDLMCEKFDELLTEIQ